MFVFVWDWHHLVKKLKELLHLLFGEVCVVTGVLDLEGVNFGFTSGDDIGQRAEAWVTHRNPHRLVPVFLQQFNESVLAVEAASAPLTESFEVSFLHDVPSLL